MKKRKGKINSLFRLWLFLFFSLIISSFSANIRYQTIEDFESGNVNLISYSNEDQDPGAWELTSSDTYDNSAWALRLYGNTWKLQMINPASVDSGTVFQVAAKTSTGARIQGVGFSDGNNVLFYSFAGTQTLNIEEWVTVYQGAFNAGTWNIYQLPIADDWYAYFDYLPVISSLVYINDLDGVSNRNFLIDSILNITEDIGIPPAVTISYQITFQSAEKKGTRDVGVQFSSQVIDPDSYTFTYQWDFGDSLTSSDPNPFHIYTVTDNHPYRATLKVLDDSNKWGLASCLINVDPGPDTFPLRMNFVGDIMLARGYESIGGIIPTLGVNAIFQPTRELLGNAADITVANLEVVLTNQGTPHPTKSVVYRGNPANVSGLVYAGIDKVCLANNHTMDYGWAGLNQMLGNLSANTIEYSGAGINSYDAYTPAFINRNGLNIAFLASSDRTGQYNNAQPYLNAGYNKPGIAYMTPYYILQQLYAVQNVADLKIMEFHAGSEYSLAPGSNYDKSNPFLEDNEDEDYNPTTDVPHMWDIAIRHFAIDSGADLVIVHHPHIIQGIEVYQGKVIAHSLGNFAFDLTYPETMPSMIFYADASRDGFSNFLIKPVFIDNFIPKPATGQLGKYILDYLAMRSTDLDTKLLVDYNNISASVIVDNNSALATSHPYSFNMFLSPVSGQGNLTDPFKLPRYGSISKVDYITPCLESEYRLGAETIWYGNFEDEGCNLWDIPEFSTTDVFDGERSAKLSPSPNQTLTATIKRRCKWYDNNKKYTLYGWIKTINASNANIIIRYYNSRSSGMIGYEYLTTNINGNTDWTFYYKELTIPSSAWYYDIRLTCSNASSGNAYALFDNVGLIEWTAWTAFDSHNSISNPNNYYWMQVRTQENPKSITVKFTEKLYERFPDLTKNKSTKNTPISVFPNPFKDNVRIEFQADDKGKIKLEIYNIRGQKVKTLANDIFPEGKNQLIWDGKDFNGQRVSAGVYFLRLEQGENTIVKKMLYLH